MQFPVNFQVDSVNESAMKKLEFIETILLDADNDMLELVNERVNGPTAVYDTIIDFQKPDG